MNRKHPRAINDEIVLPSRCDICIKSNTNDKFRLIKCCRCNGTAHAKCLGNDTYDSLTCLEKYICDSCIYSEINQINIRCELCHINNNINDNGYLLMTDNNKWVHGSCVYWLSVASMNKLDFKMPKQQRSDFSAYIVSNESINKLFNKELLRISSCEYCHYNGTLGLYCDDCDISYHVHCCVINRGLCDLVDDEFQTMCRTHAQNYRKLQVLKKRKLSSQTDDDNIGDSDDDDEREKSIINGQNNNNNNNILLDQNYIDQHNNSQHNISQQDNNNNNQLLHITTYLDEFQKQLGDLQSFVFVCQDNLKRLREYVKNNVKPT